MSRRIFDRAGVTVTTYSAGAGRGQRLQVDAPGDLGGPPSLSRDDAAALVAALRAWLSEPHRDAS